MAWTFGKPWSWFRKVPEAVIPVVLYTRQGCHLCEDVQALLARCGRGHQLSVRTIDIDADPDLVARFGDKVPVIEIDGRPRLWGKVNEVLMRRLLNAHTAKRGPQAGGR